MGQLISKNKSGVAMIRLSSKNKLPLDSMEIQARETILKLYLDVLISNI